MSQSHPQPYFNAPHAHSGSATFDHYQGPVPGNNHAPPEHPVQHPAQAMSGSYDQNQPPQRQVRFADDPLQQPAYGAYGASQGLPGATPYTQEPSSYYMPNSSGVPYVYAVPQNQRGYQYDQYAPPSGQGGQQGGAAASWDPRGPVPQVPLQSMAHAGSRSRASASASGQPVNPFLHAQGPEHFYAAQPGHGNHHAHRHAVPPQGQPMPQGGQAHRQEHIVSQGWPAPPPTHPTSPAGQAHAAHSEGRSVPRGWQAPPPARSGAQGGAAHPQGPSVPQGWPAPPSGQPTPQGWQTPYVPPPTDLRGQAQAASTHQTPARTQAGPSTQQQTQTQTPDLRQTAHGTPHGHQPSDAPQAAPGGVSTRGAGEAPPPSGVTFGKHQRGGQLAPPDGIVPIDFGPGVSYQESLALWYTLSENDQRRLIELHKQLRQPEHSQAPTATAESPMLVDMAFTMGSASAAKANARRSRKSTVPDATRRSTRRKPSAPTPSQKGYEPVGSASATHAPDGSRKRVKTAYVEEAEDESVNGHHATASGVEATASGFIDPSLSGLRPSASAYTAAPEAEADLGIIMLNAVHNLGQRMGRMEDTLNAHIAGDHPRRKSKKRSAKRSRGNLSTAEGEDFTAEMDGVTADDEGDDEGSESDAESDWDSGSESDIDRDEDYSAKAVNAAVAKRKAADKPHLIRLAACVRYHLKRKLLKFKNIKSLPQKQPTLSAEELKEYEACDDDFFTPETFRIDFVRGWKQFAFNVEAREFFIDHFLETVQGGAYSDPPIPAKFLTRTWVGNLLDAHMPHLRSEFKKYASPLTDKDLERQRKTVLRKRNAARQKTSLKVRKLVLNLHGLRRHLVLLDKMKPCHMSGDDPEVDSEQERQTHPRTYFIVEAFWQSAALITFLRTLDAWHKEDWRQCIGDRLPGGNPPRRRIEKAEPRVVDSVAPIGLWKNCYSDAFLDSLKPHMRQKLQIIDEDYDFSLPAWAQVDPKVRERVKAEEDALKKAKKAAKQAKAANKGTRAKAKTTAKGTEARSKTTAKGKSKASTQGEDSGGKGKRKASDAETGPSAALMSTSSFTSSVSTD